MELRMPELRRCPEQENSMFRAILFGGFAGWDNVEHSQRIA